MAPTSPELRVSSRTQDELVHFAGELVAANALVDQASQVLKDAQARSRQCREAEYDWFSQHIGEAVRLKGSYITAEFASAEAQSHYRPTYENPIALPAAKYIIGDMAHVKPPESGRQSLPIVWLLPQHDENVIRYGTLLDNIRPASTAEVRRVARSRRR